MEVKSCYSNKVNSGGRTEVRSEDVPPELGNCRTLLVPGLRFRTRALKVASEDEQGEASLLGWCLPRSVITQTQQNIKPWIIETSTYDEFVTILKAIYSTQKSDRNQGLRSTKLVTALITQCEEKTYEETVTEVTIKHFVKTKIVHRILKVCFHKYIF